jgi:predicted nucleic acid-binding protein
VTSRRTTTTTCTAGRRRAASAVARLLESRGYELDLIDVETLRGALDHLRRFAGKRLSFTDCTSFAVMRRLHVGTAFRFDRDLRDCGFGMVP